MEFLRYLLFTYAVIGLFVAGGVFFNKNNKANIFLAAYLLVFTIGQFNFLYSTSELQSLYPNFTGLTIATWTLYGPFLWFYIKYYQHPKAFSFKKMWGHFIPFLFYLCFTFFLLTYTGKERIVFLEVHFSDVLMPFNYGIAILILIYGVLIVREAKRLSLEVDAEQKIYLQLLTVLYVIMAVVQSFLTVFAGAYIWFIYYFLIASSIMILVGFVLYYKPRLLHQMVKKYYTSSLQLNQKKVISAKIIAFLSEEKNLLNREMNLKFICEGINEKKHHVSQCISEELNTTLKELINENRIDFAKKLLQDPSFDHLKIFAVALDSGFTNKSTFNRAFTKYTKTTPNEFRKKRGRI